MNRQDRRRQISTLVQRTDAGQRYAADMKVATGLQKQGKHAEAVALYRRILKAYDGMPDLRVAWSNMGAALQLQGKLEDAVKALKKARSMDPSQPAAHHNLGMALVEQGKVDEGLDSLARAIELQPRFRDAWIGFLQVADQTGHIARAEDLCRTVLAADPDSLAALLALGEVLRRQGRFTEAIDRLNAVIAQEQGAYEAHISLALARLGLGEPVAAADGLLEAVGLMPQVAPLHRAMVEVLVQVKAADAAASDRIARAWAATVPADQQVAAIAGQFALGAEQSAGQSAEQAAGEAGDAAAKATPAA
ncbi:MAG: hypothetical protein RLY86_2342 [Pseudomonadota bacterium]|jgi:tetratricopeptide (TPR) repeat protein